MDKEDRYDEMLRMRLSGASYAEIGARFGVTRQRAYQLLAPPGQVRDSVVKRAQGNCEECGISVGRSGAVHHGEPTLRDRDWFNSPERLQLLCPACHRTAHPVRGDVATRRPRRALKANADLRYEMQRRQITVTALAKELNVARSTLSTRLNSPDGTEPAFRDRVLSALGKIEELKR